MSLSCICFYNSSSLNELDPTLERKLELLYTGWEDARHLGWVS
jgi:hypothetical protein